jgi:hypothetical protein
MKSFLKSAIRPAIGIIVGTIIGTVLYSSLIGDYSYYKNPSNYIMGFIIVLISLLFVQYRRSKKKS